MIIKNKIKISNWLNLILSIVSSYSICLLFTDFKKYSSLTFIMAVIIYFFVNSAKKIFYNESSDFKKAKSNSLLTLILSCFISLGVCLNSGISAFFDMAFGGSIKFFETIFIYFGITVVSYWLVLLSVSLFCRFFSYQRYKREKRLHFLTLFIAFCIVYSFWYISNYPGYITPDNYAQLHMFEDNGVLSNHHPIMHSLLINLTVNIIGKGNPVVYFIVQIPILSAIYSYVTNWIGKNCKSNAVYWLSCAFFGLFPLNWIAASSMVKDFMFGAFVLLLTVSIADIIKSDGKSLSKFSGLFLFIISLLGTVFFRNNGIFIVATSALVIPFVLKQNKLRFAFVAITIVALFAVLNGIVYPTLNIQPSNIAETLGVPIQQISRTVHDNGNISAEENNYINKIIPTEIIKSQYNPSCVDPIKFNTCFNSKVIENNFGYFLKVWYSLLIKNPKCYLKAYFELTEMLWNPFYCSGVYEVFSQSTYFTEIKQIQIIPILPQIMDLVFSITQYSSYSGILHPFWNPACYLIISFILALITIVHKRSKLITVFLPCWSLWVTLLCATPIASAGRYMYSIFVCVPVFLAISSNCVKNHC